MSNSNHTLRGFLPLGVSRKRKESESGPKPVFKKPSNPSFISKPVPLKPTAKKDELKPPACDNRVLAGYMANEFLSKGKLFGQKYDKARAEAAPLSAKKARADHTKKVGNEYEAPKQIQPNNGKQEEPQSQSQSQSQQRQRYAEVANLLKRDGTHIPGIVNPTQLARWLQQVPNE